MCHTHLTLLSLSLKKTDRNIDWRWPRHVGCRTDFCDQLIPNAIASSGAFAVRSFAIRHGHMPFNHTHERRVEGRSIGFEDVRIDWLGSGRGQCIRWHQIRFAVPYACASSQISTIPSQWVQVLCFRQPISIILIKKNLYLRFRWQ